MLRVVITEKVNIEAGSDANAAIINYNGKNTAINGIETYVIEDVRVITFQAFPPEGENQKYILALPDRESLTFDATLYNISAMGV